MVIGIPNVGKSTFINRMGGQKIAQTGDRPGVTRANRWVKIGPYLELLDTPGMLPPRLDDQEAARDLGCNSFGVLRRVIFPLSLPGVISGVTMVLIPSISTFYISQKLGNGKFYLIGDAIEGQYVANNLHFAAAIAFILMVILLIGMALMQRFANSRAAA